MPSCWVDRTTLCAPLMPCWAMRSGISRMLSWTCSHLHVWLCQQVTAPTTCHLHLPQRQSMQVHYVTMLHAVWLPALWCAVTIAYRPIHLQAERHGTVTMTPDEFLERLAAFAVSCQQQMTTCSRKSSALSQIPPSKDKIQPADFASNFALLESAICSHLGSYECMLRATHQP